MGNKNRKKIEKSAVLPNYPEPTPEPAPELKPQPTKSKKGENGK